VARQPENRFRGDAVAAQTAETVALPPPGPFDIQEEESRAGQSSPTGPYLFALHALLPRRP
jgi:hypothetical protein